LVEGDAVGEPELPPPQATTSATKQASNTANQRFITRSAYVTRERASNYDHTAFLTDCLLACADTGGMCDPLIA
jgi:hypothetical protein